MADHPDALRPEREAFLAASRASMDATLDARLIEDEQPSPERDKRLLVALQRMADAQAAALVAHDRFVTRGEQVGLSSTVLAGLREGRADFALQLQRTLAEVERLGDVMQRAGRRPVQWES